MTSDPERCQSEYRQPQGAPPATSDAPGFLSMENLKILQVPAVGGVLNGFSIGFVGVYATLYKFSTDCSLYKSQAACGTVQNAKCMWDTASSTCGWKDVNCGKKYSTETECVNDSRCRWLYDSHVCKNIAGYSSLYEGIFAGAMIVGALFGSMFAGHFIARFGTKVSFLVCGILGVVSSVMYHASSATDEYWVLCSARLLIGAALGLVCVVCPMYVDQNAHPRLSKVDGVTFQVSTTFGIMLAAMVGLALGQSVDYGRDARMRDRMQGFCIFSTLLSALMIALGVFLGEGKARFAVGKHDADDGCDVMDPNEYSYARMLGPLLMGVVVAGTLQLTGINAVMNYAPRIMSNLGLEPLVGNFVVMAWNFVTTFPAIPLASFFTMRQLFLGASLVAAASCLLLCGIPVYPGVSANTSVKNGFAITGIAVFIAAFEFGVGPCFFVLAQDLFPPSFRPRGSAFVVMVQYLFNIIINICYPIATEAISGGLSGDQDKGQAVAFIFFGSTGLVCFILQVFFMFPWEDRARRGPGDAPTSNTLQE